MTLTCVEVLVPVVMMLTGCGVAPKVIDPAVAAGVERCGPATRACWQVKTTVAAEEYPPAASAKPAAPQDGTGTSRGSQ